MAIKVDLSELKQSIAAKQRALSDSVIEEKLMQTATEYVERLTANVQGKVSGRATGTMQRALTTIVPPWRTTNGMAIGVGDYAKIGHPKAAAPQDTIRQFRDWLEKSGDARAERAKQEIVKEQAERVQERRAIEVQEEAQRQQLVEEKASLRKRINDLSAQLVRLRIEARREVNAAWSKKMKIRVRWEYKDRIDAMAKELERLRQQLESM